jgi:flagella basal body P-ring formation protein FlgA
MLMRVLSSSDVLSHCRTALAILACAAGPAYAGDDVQQRVIDAARERLSEHAERLRLADPVFHVTAAPRDGSSPPRPCSAPIEIETVSDSHLSRMRFAAVCNAAEAWRIEYVVRAVVSANVVVARADAPARQPIPAERLEVSRRELSGTLQPVSTIEEVAGLASRRALRSGQIVDARWLIQPLLVRRGERVDILARNAGVEVRVAAEAMHDGRRGEEVEVRNLKSGKLIRARVVGAGVVEPVDIATSSTSQ